jgi:hypothetical protein
MDSMGNPNDTGPVPRQPIALYMDKVPPDIYVTVGHGEQNAAITEQ